MREAHRGFLIQQQRVPRENPPRVQTTVSIAVGTQPLMPGPAWRRVPILVRCMTHGAGALACIQSDRRDQQQPSTHSGHDVTVAQRWAPAAVIGALIPVVLAGLVGCSVPSEDGQNLEPASASTTASTSATTTPATTTTTTTTTVPTTTGQTSAVRPAPPNETGIAEQPMIDGEPSYPGSANQVEPPAVPYMPAPGPFSSCDAARAAGAAPLHRGFPGYSPALDRDGDGVACEAG